MISANELDWRWRRGLTLIRQTESAECGLACLAMISDWYGFKVDLSSLRAQFNFSQQGLTLADIIKCGQEMKLSSRALHAELSDLDKLSTPCILHWDMNHFVVLNKVTKKHCEIYDPAYGIRKVRIDTLSKHYTGVALELTPNHEFKKADHRRRVRIRDLLGRTVGVRRALLRIFLFAIALELIALMMPLINQVIIDEVLVSHDENLLNLVIIALLLLSATQSMVSMARQWFTIYLSVNFNMQWAANVFHHLIGLPIDWFEKREMGDIAAKFSSLDTIQNAITHNIIQALLDLILVAGTLSIMFIYSPTLAAIGVATSFIYALMRFVWFDSFKRAEEEIWVSDAKEQSHFLETLHGMLSVRVNGGTTWREGAWKNLNVARRNAQLNESKLLMVYDVVMDSLMALSTAGVLWLGAQLVLSGSFTAGMLIAFLSFQTRFSNSITALINCFFEYKMLSVYTERLADIVLTEKEQTDTKPFTIDEHTSQKALPVSVRGLQFSYSSNSRPLFNNLSFSVSPGEIVAIIGSSGSGKTTLAKILLGLYQPTYGQVEVFGQDTKGGALNEIRSDIGSVLQNDELFNGSILSNICFFSPQVDEQLAIKCAKLANIHDEIEAMPMGYQTLVGEMGNTISGGQKQRIVFARALYKKPKLLILDEATSHLDIANEEKITSAIRELGLPVIQIAHRPQTIDRADRIVCLDSNH